MDKKWYEDDMTLINEERAADKMKWWQQTSMRMAAWQNGGPTPPGYAVKCTGCGECVSKGHYPMDPRPFTEKRANGGQR